MEFTPNSCSSQCLGASIYRLGGSNERQVKIYAGAVRTVDMGRPDEQLCDKIFQKFRGEIFPV
jgi:hypothetical protein